MLVKIMKCSGESYWYKDKVGLRFMVDEEGSNGEAFRVLSEDNLLWIRREDCVKVDKFEKEEV